MKKQTMTIDEKLNSVRAGVLGSNDGILTVVGVLFSVSAASGSSFALLIASLANLISGAFSMASGEYASVSSQSDSEKVVVQEEKILLKKDFKNQKAAVKDFYIEKGISPETSAEIANELLARKPLETVLSVKYDIALGHYMNHLASSRFIINFIYDWWTFPLLTMILVKGAWQFPATIFATMLAMALTGMISAKLSDGLVIKAILRNIIIGLLTIFIHYFIGRILG